ncbi:MAG: hypothetical protein FWB98_04685 [Defluviitaleaceae bacterium]|nr:hypothetical protein [Defluviitaleaceae bacterium]
MSAKTNNRRQVVVVLIVIGVILAVGVFFVVNHQLSQFPTQMVNVPDVQTRVVSQDGSTHAFGARVVLEVDRSARSVNSRTLHNEVLAALSGLSYEEITSFHGMTLAREAIEERLSGTFGEDELVGVMFRDFLTGAPLPGSGGGGGSNPLLDALLGTGND